MKGKILFVVGLGIGYVLGTRAGRERYEQMKAQAVRLWTDPCVQKRVDAVEEFVKDKAPDVAEFVADGAKKVVSKVAGRTSRSGASARTTSSRSSTTSSASKPATDQ